AFQRSRLTSQRGGPSRSPGPAGQSTKPTPAASDQRAGGRLRHRKRHHQPGGLLSGAGAPLPVTGPPVPAAAAARAEPQAGLGAPARPDLQLPLSPTSPVRGESPEQGPEA